MQLFLVAYVILRGKRVQEELSTLYWEQRDKNEDRTPFPQWVEWLDKNASAKQKVEKEHTRVISAFATISKEFPAN